MAGREALALAQAEAARAEAARVAAVEAVVERLGRPVEAALAGMRPRPRRRSIPSRSRPGRASCGWRASGWRPSI